MNTPSRWAGKPDGTNMHVAVVIPARYASTRLPGKPLAEIGGVPMIVRVARRAAQCAGAGQVVVATDDERIQRACEEHDVAVVLTVGDHASGSDRCAEVARRLEVELVVNVQGDEPFIDPAAIDLLIDVLHARPDVNMATLVHPFTDWDEFASEHNVKVVLNDAGDALYFSRSPIPHTTRQAFETHTGEPRYYKHLGIYGFRNTFLQRYTKMAQTELEIQERLEQLRALQHGERIAVAVTDYDPLSVDTPEDLERARRRAVEEEAEEAS